MDTQCSECSEGVHIDQTIGAQLQAAPETTKDAQRAFNKAFSLLCTPLLGICRRWKEIKGWQFLHGRTADSVMSEGAGNIDPTNKGADPCSICHANVALADTEALLEAGVCAMFEQSDLWLCYLVRRERSIFHRLCWKVDAPNTWRLKRLIFGVKI